MKAFVPFLVLPLFERGGRVDHGAKRRRALAQLDRGAVEFLINRGYDPIYGARPMRRAVEKFLEDPLAEEFLRGNINRGDTPLVNNWRCR
jgi:ATP-dependent Clp protease ATP-binding subunit ClpA